MKFKRLGALALSLALSLSLAVPAFGSETTTPEAPAAPAPHAAELAAQYGGATAVQYALWEDGKITVSGQSGIYSKTENRALTETDLFGIGSVSKVYTTAAVMKLVEAGKIKLDSPVTTYLPDFKMADQRYKDITVRMLLNHSSGFLGGSTSDAFLFGDTDQIATTDLLERLSTQRLKADPGAFSVYCNDGFTLAELVVEAVSGQSFGAYIHEQLLKPAGLENTFVPQDEFDTGRLVKTYAAPTDTRALPQDTLGTVGTGGIYATAADLAAFGGALTGTKLLSAKSTAAMAAPEYKNGMWPADDADLLSFGLGWDAVKVYPFALSDIQGLSKGGDTLYYHAALVVIPKYKMAAAVLTSGGVSTYNQLAACRMLIDALSAKGVTVDETVPALPAAKAAAMPKALMENSGYYGSAIQQMKIDVTEDGTLSLHSLTVPSMPNQVFTYCDDGSFRDATGAGMMKFVKETNGETYLWQKGWGAIPGLTLMPASNYLAQKLPEGTTDQAVLDAWAANNALALLPLNEKYTSQIYMSLAQAPAEMPELVPGYVGVVRFEDATTAKSAIQIPGTGGRDSQDMTVTETDGVTYLSTNQGILYGEADVFMKPLYTGAGAYSTIGTDGYARWYSVKPGDAGKTVQIETPANGGFWLYDEKGTVIEYALTPTKFNVTLPLDGIIVFAGDVGARFRLSPVEGIRE